MNTIFNHCINGLLIVLLCWFLMEIQQTSASLWTRNFEDIFRYGSFAMKNNLTNHTIVVYNATVEKLKAVRQRQARNPTWYWNGGTTDNEDGIQGQSKAHKIVHLNSRPTQVYYQSTSTFTNESKDNNQQQICEARVSINDIYITFDDSNKAYVDIFFYCTGWCCGIDCCQLSITLIFAVCCVGVVIFVIIGNICLRTIGKRLLTIRAMRRLGAKRRKRHIVRANAQRRRGAGDEFDDNNEQPSAKSLRTTQRNRITASNRRIQIENPEVNKSKAGMYAEEPLIPQTSAKGSPPLIVIYGDENKYIKEVKISVEENI